MSTQISHDAFARRSLLRDSVETSKSCDWCGRAKKAGKLFVYSIEGDGFGARPNAIKGYFCSIQCMRSYHND